LSANQQVTPEQLAKIQARGFLFDYADQRNPLMVGMAGCAPHFGDDAEPREIMKQ
jgi:hypothetical protein